MAWISINNWIQDKKNLYSCRYASSYIIWLHKTPGEFDQNLLSLKSMCDIVLCLSKLNYIPKLQTRILVQRHRRMTHGCNKTKPLNKTVSLTGGANSVRDDNANLNKKLQMSLKSGNTLCSFSSRYATYLGMMFSSPYSLITTYWKKKRS